MNNTAIVSQATIDAPALAKLDKLVKNLYARYYYAQIEQGKQQVWDARQKRFVTRRFIAGNQLNKLQRAYEALAMEDADLAIQAWDGARRNTNEQFIQRGLGCTFYLEPMQQSTGKRQADYLDELNSLYEAFPNWERDAEHDFATYIDFENMTKFDRSALELADQATAEAKLKELNTPQVEDYDGTNVRAIKQEEEELLGWQPSATYDEHAAELDTLMADYLNYKSMRRLHKMARLADILEGGRDHQVTLTKKEESIHKQIKWDHTPHTQLPASFKRATYQVRIGLDRLRSRGYVAKYWNNSLDEDTVDQIADALQWFERHSDTLESNPLGDLMTAEWGKDADGNTTVTVIVERQTTDTMPLEDITPQAVTEDITRGIQHNGWRMNRKASLGVGSLDPVDQLHHMPMEVFYSMLRTRELKFARVELHRIMQPTAYKTGADGKKAVLPHNHIDNVIRSLCMCKWHDEVHSTSYFQDASHELMEKYDYAEKAIELAHVAIGSTPCSLDTFRRKLYMKEMKQLKAHSWGPFHSKAKSR